MLAIKTAESKSDNFGEEFPTKFGQNCYVHLPSYRRQKINTNGQLIVYNLLGSWSQIVRVACLRSSKILPFLDGHSPLLFATIDADLNEFDKNLTSEKNIDNKKGLLLINLEKIKNVLF